MSIEADRNKIIQINKKITQLENNLNQEKKKKLGKINEVNTINRSITKNMSQGILQSKKRQIVFKKKELLSYEKKIIDFENKISSSNLELLKLISEIDKTAKIEQNKNIEIKHQRENEQKQTQLDREENQRRNIELNHQRKITRELEEQNNLHKQFVKSTNTIEFEKLPEKIVVLFIASNPINQTQLRLDEEIRGITRKIRESKYRDSVELKSIWATRPNDLLQAINEHTPTIIHFSGHGSSNDELILQNDIGEATSVSLETIVEIFKIFASSIKLIVFNTCFSKNQANKITDYIPAAIGMNTAVGDESAIVFSSQLYSAIGFGRSIQDSFNQAKVAIMLEKLGEEKTPQLYLKKGIDGEKLFFVKLDNDKSKHHQSNETNIEKKDKEFVFYRGEEKVTYDKKMISLDKDVIKIYAHSHAVGVEAEYEWIKHMYPNSKTIMQSLTTLNSLIKRDTKKEIYFDILKIKLPDERIKEIYFDISEFVRDGMITSLSNIDDYMENKLSGLYTDIIR